MLILLHAFVLFLDSTSICRPIGFELIEEALALAPRILILQAYTWPIFRFLRNLMLISENLTTHVYISSLNRLPLSPASSLTFFLFLSFDFLMMAILTEML